MNNSFITKTRKTLIVLGKVLPFLVCAIILISNCENVVSLATNDYMQFGEDVFLRKPISWEIGKYFRYDFSTIIVLSVLSIAIQTCIYNKLACAYLAINLYEKSYFLTHEFENEIYYIISITNVLVCAFLCYKGIKRTIKCA